MSEGAVDPGENTRAVLHPTKGIDRPHVRSLWEEANRLLKERSVSRLVLELDEVSRIDGAGVALVRGLQERCRRRGIEFSIEGATQPVSEFVEFVRRRSPEPVRQHAAPHVPRSVLLARTIAGWGRRFKDVAEFVGRFAESAAFLVTHPHKLRFREVLFYVQTAGAEGMWLLGGLSLLLGVIMAFQGISGARGFGSPVLVADVVTMSTLREMAPLLTGVIVTGRSGAAFAAEIGSMKIHEEIDALSVMGFDVMRFLFVPRTLGLIISTPLLTLLSVAAGIVGGAGVAAFVLHLTAANYFSEVENVLSATQLATALAKGAVFGLMIGMTASFQGLQAGRAAEDVGRQTTTAVVRSILLIIFMDAFFSILSEVYRW